LGSRAEGLQHILQAVDNRHDEPAYIFGIITIEYNNSPVEVEEALLHVDKFSTPSLYVQMIREWIRSVRWKTVITLLRYEELRWGHWFFANVHDLPQYHTPGCQPLIFRNTWENERWMTLCSRTCWWRHEHQMFAATFTNTPQPQTRGYSIYYVSFNMVVLNNGCDV
jgi:hypothetical protein